MSGRRGVLAGLALLLAVVLAGCTGIPASSPPEVITTLGGGQPAPTLAVTPPPGAAPREIVSDFLTALRYPANAHAAARGFLTPAAVQRWKDSSTVTVLDSLQVGNFSGQQQVVVTGREVGQLNANGVYTPVLKGDGSGGDPVSYTYGMKQVNGQWRIDQLHDGVVVDYSTFESIYAERVLYFFDLTDRHLVADLRYTPISDPALLASWLVNQLAVGPRPDLQAAVNNQLPAQADPTRVGVISGSPTQVVIPGAAGLDAATRNLLAAELSLTLQPVTSDVSIVDSGRAVPIPLTGGTAFTPSEFSGDLGPARGVPALYYLDLTGHVLDGGGNALPGHANGQYALTSVALDGSDPPSMLVAGTAATGSQNWLYVGTASGGLRRTQLHGVLSRPAWAPDVNEVWIGNGNGLFRVSYNGRVRSVAVSASAGIASGRITAVRFSPEGTRIALVLDPPNGPALIYVGSVVRPVGGAVSVDDLVQVSPQGVSVSDVAWNGQLKLFATGRDVSTNEPSIYELQVDGSLWTPRGNANLPGAADSITIAENQLAWVSTGQTVWEQRAGGWVSPKGGQTAGTKPVYTE